MKISKYLNKTICSILIIIFMFSVFIANVYAHDSLLDIEYIDYADDEIWFDLNHTLTIDDEKNGISFTQILNSHISDEEQTIKYYYNNYSNFTSDFYWGKELTDSEVSIIKHTFSESMKKWNDVYYYTYDNDGFIVRNKIINIEEVDNAEEANLIIYPINDYIIEKYLPKIETEEGESPNYFIAATEFLSSINVDDDNLEYIEDEQHLHCSSMLMYINLDLYNPKRSDFQDLKEYTGAHEMGHVLGLADVDDILESSDTFHPNLLMGYESGSGNPIQYIPYQDVAGVSITRGFHTDDDHIWMKRMNNDGTVDVICALCNGIRKNHKLFLNSL